MELKNSFAQDSQGNVIPEPVVHVYMPGTTTYATGLKNQSGIALSNPFAGELDGKISFAAPDGDYDVKVSGGGRETTVRMRFIDSVAGSAEILRNDLASNAAGKGAELIAFSEGTVAEAIAAAFSQISSVEDSVSALSAHVDDGVSDLASTASGKGASLVGYRGDEDVKEALDARLPEIGSYALLRAYTGPVTAFFVRGVANIFDGGFGPFRVDASDTTSLDNGGTVLVDAAGRRWKRDFAGPAFSKWFSPVADGVVDNTLEMIAAMEYCHDAGIPLGLQSTLRFVASSVPAGKKISTYYVKSCSMYGIGNAILKVEGKIGFDLAGVDQTFVGGFSVITTGRESVESDAESTAPHLFSSRSGTKKSAVYRNIAVLNTLTDTTGAYRVGPVVYDTGADVFEAQGITANGVTIGVAAIGCASVNASNVDVTNAQTGVYVSGASRYAIHDIKLINTKEQANHWIARTNATPRAANGLDTVLVESGGVGQIHAIRSEWPIERAVYAQSRRLDLFGASVLNGDGIKVVGVSRTDPLVRANVSDCHLTLDSDYAVGVGRDKPNAFITYWSKNVDVIGCTAANASETALNLESFALIGRDAATVENLNFKACRAVNANEFAYISLMTSTAAQLAVIDPAQTFAVVDGLSIANCYLKKPQIRRFGSLTFQYDGTASADAKATHAVKNLNIVDNEIELNTSGGQDDWIFDPRYVNGATSKNTRVNAPFFGSFFAAAVTEPHAGILMDEPYLRSSGAAALTARLTYLNVLKRTRLKFSSNAAATVFEEYEVNTYADGAASTGVKTISIRGVGYYAYNVAANCAIQMTASGLFYAGRAVGGAKTDQVGTPPVGITVSASNLEIRGDLVPTTQYSATLVLH